MKGVRRWARSGVVLAIGALAAWLAIPGTAVAQYPPPTGSVTLSAADPTPAVGESVVLSVEVIDPAGAPVSGLSCSFAITQQPGADASVWAGPAVTDAAGRAETTLNVGSAEGLIAVQARCGELSALTSVVAGAAAAQPVALPATGDGAMASSDGAFPWQFALAAGVGLTLVAVGVRRVLGSRRSG